MAEPFTSEYAVDPTAGYDASKLKGKSVVVTGGASGIGEEMARQFVNAGAFVTIGDISSENGKKVVSKLGEDNAAFVQCDVLTWSDQVNLFKTAVERSPSKSVDIVCANAGISGLDTVWRDGSIDPKGPLILNNPLIRLPPSTDAGADSAEPIEPDLSILKINLIGVTYTAKLAVHYFNHPPDPDAKKCLIMTASLAGYLDQPGSPQYCSSKWGVRGMMHSLRRTMPGMGMRVNIIAPWFIKTPIMSPEVQKRVEERGITFAEKGDAAAAVLHMASDESINGRCCTIVPRDIAPQGYMDLVRDDNAEDDLITLWQNLAMKASHRMGTK